MNDQSTTLALAALRHWAELAANDAVGAAAQDAADDLVRRTAWLTVGQADPADGTWPTLLTGPLVSVFSRITRNGATLPTALFRPNSLRLSRDVLFPTIGTSEQPPTDEARANLRTALDKLDQRLEPVVQLEAVLFALQRHAWSLPSPLAAVSLYDFARTHAALAAALAATPDGEICLVGGDLSGVQDFIYSVTAKGATRQLRGRSLYLQLLTDACVQSVLEAAKMPLCNLLYAGGGHFYALLPGAAQAELPKLRKELGTKLKDAHHGALYLALGAASFRPADYAEATWAQLSQALEQDKRRRFAALPLDEFRELFQPKQPEPPREETDESEPQTPMGESLEQLGSRLQQTKLFALRPLTPTALAQREHRYHDVLGSLGLAVRLLDEDDKNIATRQRLRLLSLDDSPLPAAVVPGRDDVVGLRYTVAEAPSATAADVVAYQRRDFDQDDQELHAGDVLPFNLLAAQSHGVSRLGVLRMDVDDLGELFGRGLNRANGVAALVSTAALSGALSRFFEGWVGELCRKQNADQADGGVYAVYSGGDDLFLVGSWHRMPGLARQIRQDFGAYVLGRELQRDELALISVSAGLTLIDAGYPLYQAAKDAAEALDAAKAHKRPGSDGRPKDALNFLGQTLGWEQFDEVEQLCAELQALLAGGAPRALLMTIQNLAAQASSGGRRSRDGAPQFAYGPWVWQGAYQLTRMAERAGPKGGREAIEAIRERIVGTVGVQTSFIVRAGLAARWAQLLIRGERNDKEER